MIRAKVKCHDVAQIIDLFAVLLYMLDAIDYRLGQQVFIL
jgi:hypothetical protein